MSDDTEENPIETEIETLEAIYINELSYKRKTDGTLDTIELLLHPATGDEIGKQFVCMTVVFTPSPKYPDEIPAIDIKNPRGLGEEEIASLVEDMISKAHECVGEVMLFTLIEMAKDCLTEGNIPHCPCMVCLEHFHENDLFHRTACYHYFHNKCLWRYLEHSRRKIEEESEEEHDMRHREVSEEKKVKTIGCPVCRAPLDEDSLSFRYDCIDGEQQDVEELEFVLSPAMKEQQVKMAEGFARQKAKGGIIDLEQEKNKNLVNAEACRPVLSTSPVQKSSQNQPEVLPNKYAKDFSPHEKSHPNIDLRQGRKERQDGSKGSRRGHHNHQRVKYDDNHYSTQQKSQNQKYPHHQHQSAHGQGRGKNRYSTSAGRSSHHHNTGFCDGKETSDDTKVYRNDTFLRHEINEARVFDKELGVRQDSSVSNRTNLPYQNFEFCDEARQKLDSPDSDSRQQKRQHDHSSYSEQKDTEGTRRGRTFGGRSRGRGGNFSSVRKLDNSEREAFQGDINKTRSESRKALNNLNDRHLLSESDHDKDKEQRTYQRRRGHGGFRDFEKVYFDGKIDLSDSHGNPDKPSESRKEAGSRRRGGGCRERHKPNQHRDNEYDDNGDGSQAHTKRSAGTGRNERNGHRAAAGIDCRRDGAGGQVSQPTGSSNHHQLQESWREQAPNGIDDICDKSFNQNIDKKIKEELEMNRRWRKLNFGYVTSEAKHESPVCSKVDDGSKDRNDISSFEPHNAFKFEDESISSSNGYIAPSENNDLNQYYVGYGEDEEEDWEEERFLYAFERRHIRNENIEEYDKFRRHDYEICRKKVEERGERERLLREEDRRIRREQAELERKFASTNDSKPTKSVLELFQEKQEAKRRKAEVLKQEQQLQEEKSEKSSTKISSDGGFQSGSPIASSLASETDSLSSLSSFSQGNQSSTEELSHHDLQVQDDIGSKARSVLASSEPESDMTGKADGYGQIASEILWVGVKKKPIPDPYNFTLNKDTNVARPRIDDPSQDAWERREERKMARNKKDKMNKNKVDRSFLVADDDSRTETEKANDVLVLSKPIEILDDCLNNKTGAKNLSSNIENNGFTESMTNTSLKQKPLSKAPPLKLSMKMKHKTPTTPANCLAGVGLPDLTKNEVAELKALYMTDKTIEALSLSQVHKVNSEKALGFTFNTKEVGSELSYVQASTSACEDKVDVLEGNVQKERSSYTSELVSSSFPKTSLNEQSETKKKKYPAPHPVNKTLKKAPPLNLKQNLIKANISEKNKQAHATLQGMSGTNKAGHKDISMVMKFLGIELSENGDDALLADSCLVTNK